MHGPIVYILILLAATVLPMILAAYSLPRRYAPGSLYFGILMLSTAFYAGGYALELSSQTLEAILRVVRFEYFGIATLPAWWLLFALNFSGRRTSPGFVLALLAVPIVTLVLVWTMDFHRLYYASCWLRTDGPFPVIGMERGPWYWVANVYMWLCLLAGNVVLIRYARRAVAEFRSQARLAAFASLAPWISNGLYVLGLTPWGLDLNAFAVPLAGVVFAFAMYRHGFLDLIPVARERVLETMREGMVVVDSKKRIVDTNQAAREILGLGKDAVGRGIRDAAPGRGDLAALVEAGEGIVRFSLSASGMQDRHFRANVFPVSDDRGRCLGNALILNDVSETKALMERLSTLAGTDELTKAFNRRRFLEYGERELAVARRMGRPTTVLMVDLDHFKRVNDSFGHAAGDQVLRTACARIQAGLRGTDLLCRYGGEEFALLLPETDPQRGLEVAERLRADIAGNPVDWEGQAIAVTASFGLFGSVPGAGATLEDWLRQADRALYASKAGGRNRVTCLEE